MALCGCERFRKGNQVTTFVLVHGAWHGSWCWKRVRKNLHSLGHEVFTPTLTGVADRSHLAFRAVNLETHILDAWPTELRIASGRWSTSMPSFPKMARIS